MAPSQQDSCHHCDMTGALQKSQEVKGWVPEAPPSLVPLNSDLSCQLSTHRQNHAAKDISTRALITDLIRFSFLAASLSG